MANEKKPVDANFIRLLKIVGGAVVIGGAVFGGVYYVQTSKSPIDSAKADLGKVIPNSNDSRPPEVSEASKAKLARVQEAEAEAARRAGKSYIPDILFEKPETVTTPADAALAGPGRRASDGTTGPGRNQQATFAERQKEITQQQQAEYALIQEGLKYQMDLLAGALKPATTAVVAIVPPQPQQGGMATTRMTAADQTGAPGGPTNAKANGPELVGGLEIVAAVMTTPVNTDTSKFAMAEITGGPLAGAVLRGEVVPMRQSGDIEDVGIKFTSMRFKDKMYKIDAIALNEKTASDAMNGDVDRKVLTRYVMPIIMAGLSGAATYFTAMGTPATSVAPSATYGNGSIIVNQNAATADQAMNQGVGRGIDKAANLGERAVDRLAIRPNKVTLDPMTPIGIMFNAPVFKNQPN